MRERLLNEIVRVKHFMCAIHDPSPPGLLNEIVKPPHSAYGIVKSFQIEIERCRAGESQNAAQVSFVGGIISARWCVS